MQQKPVEDDVIVETYVLKDPVQYGEEKIYQLEFRTLKAEHNIKVEQITKKGAGQMEAAALYIHLLCKVVPYIVNNMSHRDFVKAAAIVDSFLLKGFENPSEPTWS